MPRRLIGVALLALSLAGCFGGGDNGSAGYRPYTAVARFLPGDEVNVIQVFVTGQIESTASIRLSDPEAYLKDWRYWQVRLRIGDPPNVNVLSLPAPQPPATF